MLLTITTTHRPATDLGYLLHKHPDRFQTFSLPFGSALVGYPQAGPQRCTAALVVDVDPVELARRGRGTRTLYEYVNDRPYVASSLLSVALARVLGSALRGRCDARPELAGQALPLEAGVTAVTCDDGAEFVRGLFEPLGYTVGLEQLPLDDAEPRWGASHHYRLLLAQRTTLQALLGHLYVLLPVLDDAKHYWVSDDEIDKLLRYGDEWLAAHPLRDEISHRYLRRRRHLSRRAAERLAEDAPAGTADEQPGDHRVAQPRLRDLRMDAVVEQLRACGAASVVDLGCGDGVLLQRLLPERQITRIVGVDASVRALQRAQRRLGLEQLSPQQRDRFELLHGALTYTDARLSGFDAAALVEVVEHVEAERLPALERTVFAAARPGTVVLTTPNAEYNARFPALAGGALRHADHRFEWTRTQFQQWARRVADGNGYTVRFLPVGNEDPQLGPATQMAVFTRGDTAAARDAAASAQRAGTAAAVTAGDPGGVA